MSEIKYKSPKIDTAVFPNLATVDGNKKRQGQGTRPPLTAFEQDLRRLINRYSMENASDTPDNILAEYLCACLKAYNVAANQRRKWYSR